MLTGCREYQERLIEMARGAAGADQIHADERCALMAHVSVCAHCGQVLEEQLALSAALQGLEAEALPEAAEFEAHVLAEFDRGQARHVSRWVLAAGLAAALFLGLVWMGRRAPVARPPATVAKVAAQPRVAAVTVAEAPRLPRRGKRQRPNGALRQPSPEPQPFLTIPYTVPLAPEERTALVRMEIPVAALRAVGFNVAVSDSGSVVEADVLVSQDGRARAIRPLSISSLR